MESQLEPPVYRAWTKAVRGIDGEPRSGTHWVRARRGWFKVFGDHVECGDWVISNSSIRDAVLYRSRQALIPVSVLRLVTADSAYQFGFNPWIQMERHLPFRLRIEEVALKRSMFSFVVRVVVLAYLASWLWRTFYRDAV